MNLTQKLLLRKVNLFTLYITLLAGLMIASLPYRAFAQKDMGQGYCSLHGNYTGASCPQCATSSSGGSSGGSSVGTQIGNVLGDAIGKALFGDPAEQARQRAAAQALALAQQRATAEAAAEAERKTGGLHAASWRAQARQF